VAEPGDDLCELFEPLARLVRDQDASGRAVVVSYRQAPHEFGACSGRFRVGGER
jgi:hypothetical protein